MMLRWDILDQYMVPPRLFQLFARQLPDLPVSFAPRPGSFEEPLLRCGGWRVDKTPGRDSVRIWNPFTCQFCYCPEETLYHALLRFLRTEAGYSSAPRAGVGLVLAGGGAKGAFEIGVWRALREAGLERRIQGLSGASIGAVNSLLFAKGDIDSAERLWREMSSPEHRKQAREEIEKRSLEYSRRLFGGNAAPAELLTNLLFVSQPELNQALNRAAAGTGDLLQTRFITFSSVTPAGLADPKYQPLFQKIPTADPPFSHLWPEFREAPFYIPWRLLSSAEIAQAVLASAAMPYAYAPVRFRGYPYLDGGCHDNLPDLPLYKSGFRQFILVELKAAPKRPDCWTAGRSDCTVICLQPRPEFQDDFAATLSLSPELTEERMRMGYEDARRQLALPENRKKLEILRGEST